MSGGQQGVTGVSMSVVQHSVMAAWSDGECEQAR